MRSSHVQYHALSYTWGDKGLTRTIICNGRRLKVTASCHAALYALRKASITKAVWIDAICIDQENVSERNAQVSRMGSIFHSATSTVIYAGHIRNAGISPKESKELERLLETFQERYSSPGYLEWSQSTSKLKFDGLASGYWELFRRSRWCERTWIIQEVVLARDINIIVESALLVPLDLFIISKSTRDHLLPQVFRIRNDLSREYSKHVSSQISANAPETLMNLSYWRLFDIMVFFREFGCQDPRDKLFAILPLFVQPAPPMLRPNDSKTTREVYTDLSWFLIDYDTPKALSLAGIGQAGYDFPSWVVNWSKKPSPVPLAQRKDREGWRAGFVQGKRRIHARRDAQVLTLRGRLVCQVKRYWMGSTWQCLSAGDEHNNLRGSDVGGTIFEPELNWPQLSSSDQQTQRIRDGIPGELWSIVSGTTFPFGGGRGCFGPPKTCAGDHICVFLGFHTAFVIRAVGDGWVLVGECYVPGIMRGEALEDVKWTNVDSEVLQEPLQDFRIY